MNIVNGSSPDANKVPISSSHHKINWFTELPIWTHTVTFQKALVNYLLNLPLYHSLGWENFPQKRNYEFVSSSNKRFGELKAKNLIVWKFSFSSFASFYIRLYPRCTGQIFDQSKIHAVRYSAKIRDGFKILAGTVDNITDTVWTPWQSEFSNVKASSWMVQEGRKRVAFLIILLPSIKTLTFNSFYHLANGNGMRSFPCTVWRRCAGVLFKFNVCRDQICPDQIW